MKYWLTFMVLSSSLLSANLHIIEEESTLSDDPRELYIDLLKRAVTNSIYEYNGHLEEGTNWPAHAHTMIGLKRLSNIDFCIKNILKNNIPGDLVETGVWRGGATIFMRGILKAYNVTDRKVWVCDSFKGLPPPDPETYPSDEGFNMHLSPELCISLETVQNNFRTYGLLDNQVRFLEGYFRDTLPTAPIEQIALLRLDGDLYESTINALENLYPKLSVGGYIIIDDSCMWICMQAVHDYRNAHQITTPFIGIDYTGLYWQKE